MRHATLGAMKTPRTACPRCKSTACRAKGSAACRERAHKAAKVANGKTQRVEVTEVKGVFPPPEKRLYEFVVTGLFKCEGTNQPGSDGGFYVEARGPSGSCMATVYGDVTRETVIGARFWRS
jgi:hypothetical protein